MRHQKTRLFFLDCCKAPWICCSKLCSNSCQCCSSRTCCLYHLMETNNTIINICSVIVAKFVTSALYSSLFSPFCWGRSSLWVEAPVHFSSYCFFQSFSYVFPVVSAPGSSVGPGLSHLSWQLPAVHFSPFSLLDWKRKSFSPSFPHI